MFNIKNASVQAYSAENIFYLQLLVKRFHLALIIDNVMLVSILKDRYVFMKIFLNIRRLHLIRI